LKTKVKNLFKNIDKAEVNFTQSIKNLYKLKLSILNEENKNSEEFYLDGKLNKEVIPFYQEKLKLFRKAFDKDPSWYHWTASRYSIEQFRQAEKEIWLSGRKKK